MKKLAIYKVKIISASEFYLDESFETREQAEAIAKMASKYHRHADYEIEEYTYNVVEDYDSFYKKCKEFYER